MFTFFLIIDYVLYYMYMYTYKFIYNPLFCKTIFVLHPVLIYIFIFRDEFYKVFSNIIFSFYDLCSSRNMCMEQPVLFTSSSKITQTNGSLFFSLRSYTFKFKQGNIHSVIFFSIFKYLAQHLHAPLFFFFGTVLYQAQ